MVFEPVRTLLVAILLFAAYLRLDGIAFGVDTDDVRYAVLNNQNDERGMVFSEIEGFLVGNMHPGSFLYRGSAGF